MAGRRLDTPPREYAGQTDGRDLVSIGLPDGSRQSFDCRNGFPYIQTGGAGTGLRKSGGLRRLLKMGVGTGKRPAGVAFRVLAWCLYAAAFTGIATIMGGVVSANDFLPFLISAFLFAGFLCDRYSRRVIAPDARSLIARHPDEFVLLLRCFSFDDYRGLGESGLGPKFEEALVNTLGRIGPVIAVGRPHEPLAPLGAARLYIRAEDWHAEVEKLMHQARAVVLVLFVRDPSGVTQGAAGFKWEIEKALSEVPPRKLLFVLPAATKLLDQTWWFGRGKKRRVMQSSLDAFKEKAEAVLPRVLDVPKGAQFVCFDSVGRAAGLRARRLKPGYAGFFDALRPFFAGLGLPRPSTSVLMLEWRYNRWFRTVTAAVACALIASWLSQLK